MLRQPSILRVGASRTVLGPGQSGKTFQLGSRRSHAGPAIESDAEVAQILVSHPGKDKQPLAMLPWMRYTNDTVEVECPFVEDSQEWVKQNGKYKWTTILDGQNYAWYTVGVRTGKDLNEKKRSQTLKVIAGHKYTVILDLPLG